MDKLDENKLAKLESRLPKSSQPEEIIFNKRMAEGLLNRLGPKAARTLGRLMDSEDDKVAFMAAQAVLDRAFGKPTQTIQSDVSTNVSLDIALEKEVRVALLGSKVRGSGEVIDVGEGSAYYDGLPDEDAEGYESGGDKEALDSGESGEDAGGSEEPSEVPRALFRRQNRRKSSKVPSLVEQHPA